MPDPLGWSIAWIPWTGPTDESSQINLESLKNVMLSYLNAKTLNQHKQLVPAIFAVLCLTPEEAAAALKSVEGSGSVESVGLSFFEGLHKASIENPF